MKAVGCAIVATLMAGVIYEQYGRWQDKQRLPQIGRSIDIGGRALNIHCAGEGSPPVILESPGAGPGLLWEPVQAEIARFTRACWYDRAGEGLERSRPISSHQCSDRQLSRQPKTFVNNSTGIVMPESYAQGRAAAGLGARPLIVLTAGQPPSFSDPEMAQQAAAYQQVWIHEMQAKLARLSTRGRQIVLPNSDHGSIPSEVIVAAVREIVTEVGARE